ncbi:MAG: YerC/YecD family TrpR-related protein [Eubacterium sp.]|jgi:TrpR-related protein YerC/YecD|nr:YerC/YecD family TrpR-related protein [Eubacterium sp.]MCH4046464.1 YerC/YecD family TrpR-related protein [Eubacterium sp.]MCH4079559.1 YerC/YecD family TrpR-related protein [Eubacterium sp.]MCH4111139.1 YerC/YecD family TrpR-related protein [Eubacterium sp.]MCI1307357.1 YerC/YecD family TrpR-related protein [Eubacterium sp.]
MAFETKLKSQENDALFDAILSLENREECYRFFTDICTINELHAISQRFQVAKLLSQDHTYNEIEKQTNASTATISRINKCLVYGADGYKIALDRMKKKEEEEKQKEAE